MNPDLLANLNPPQLQAVTFPHGNLLILAGAGSGKTRVLVHRIAWLMQNGVSASNILAVTFTNKAATEMRSRLEQMLQLPLTQMWVGTFHGLAHRLLRRHWQEAGLPQSFQIIDAEDQVRLLKRIHKTFSLDPEKWPVKKSVNFINNSKEKGLRPNRVEASNLVEETLLRVYQAYQEACLSSGLVDFAELLLRSYELWQSQPQLRQHYQERFKNILVDEFQDTNAIQYAWIKTLSLPESSLTAVGDDDQSIYSWRGADSNNMQRLSSDYANVSIIRLEQNYRSTATILNAANAVIARNNNRLGKNLWTKRHGGEPITVYASFNEIDEARYMINKMKAWIEQGNVLHEVAVLYRSNAQSRVIEEQLLYAGVPYRIYGGLKFFERAEIKDVLAYLRFIANHNDDTAFERIINLPTRGIGEATLVILRNYARSQNCSLWQAVQMMLAAQQLSSRSTIALASFTQLINSCMEQIANLEFAELVRLVINITNLRLHYEKDPRERRRSRLENLDELITAAKQFATDVAEIDGQLLLNSFLAHAALEAGEQTGDNGNDGVQLMTLHAAKGLEFPLVFLCGMEEGLFPHIMSMETEKDLEEERRLCYVGMTRAMQKLYLLYAESRQLHGNTNFRRPSRFLKEIPQELISSDTILNSVAPANSPGVDIQFSDEVSGFSLGQRVRHKTFGEGSIIGFEGQGEFMLVQVKFKREGIKWLSPQYAQIEVI
ncbi:DNA helicase II [Gammaproteobacteria bacterium]